MVAHSFFFRIILILIVKHASSQNSVWRYQCETGFCQKTAITAEPELEALSLASCRLLCSNYAALWPKPTGTFAAGKNLTQINANSIVVVNAEFGAPISDLVAAVLAHFKYQVTSLIPTPTDTDFGKVLEVNLTITDQDTAKLNLTTDESYALTISETGATTIRATIEAQTYFGGRHGLETLSQLIVHDDLRDEILILNEVQIFDAPAYPHRGILLDTARNYISVDAIKRTIDAMGASKLNAFHWHITDSHSFPYVSQSRPELSKYGAYSPKKIYTAEDVAGIVRFGLERGVKIVPEFDAPAHVGEGWQDTDFVTCFKSRPWTSYCVEPPCGQFDPTKPELYDVLEDLYGDMLAQFDPDIFHMGGDEVHFGCWNSTDSIVEWMATEKGWDRSEDDFVKLWDVFQSEALSRLYEKAGRHIPIVMWTSTLTEPKYRATYLPKDKYIIQIWTGGSDSQIAELLDEGYSVILSNYDALYLDCGFAGWVQGGNNWCSPYIGWQKVYENTPRKIAGDRKSLVLGAEAALWTEQVDSSSVDGRLWPRAAALAEALWSEPEGSWREAEQRILVHRERLVARGVAADRLEPEWCMQYEENCPILELELEDSDPGAGHTSKPLLSFCIITMLLTKYLMHILES